MKKSLLSYLLMLCILTGLLCSCSTVQPENTTLPGVIPTAPTQPHVTQPPTEPPTEPPPMNTESIDFLKLLYKDEILVTPIDYFLVDVFPVGNVTYKVVWTTDAPEDAITLIPNDDGTVAVDVNEAWPDELTYTLTASIATAEGYRLTHSWTRILPQAQDMVAIVEEAYALKHGHRMDHPVTLTGKITSVDKEWSEDYQNITVTIVVEGCERKPIRCYSLTGEGAKDLKRGDIITVTGVLQSYSSRVEFDIGCKLISGAEQPGKDTEYEE